MHRNNNVRVLFAFVFSIGLATLLLGARLPILAAAGLDDFVTERVSVSSAGEQGDGYSGYASISADGRFVAFSSTATNFVAGDTNVKRDIFVHDRQTGAVERISIAADGAQGDNDSDFPQISADGRYVAFESTASNLIIGDTNGVRDIFVHDRQTGAIERISIASDGAQGNKAAGYPSSISSDGRYIAFNSEATNLVDGDTNLAIDAFVHDRESGVTERVSVSSTGEQASQYGYSADVSISADGRYVAFISYATNLLEEETSATGKAYLRDRQAGVTTLVSVSTGGMMPSDITTGVSISGDGRYVAFESLANNLVGGDTNHSFDIFIRDLQAGTTELISHSSAGVQGNNHSADVSISNDGSQIAFSSAATNLVDADTNNVVDVFVHDRTAGSTERVSISSTGDQADGDSYVPDICADGSIVAFESIASTLVTGDTNALFDVFVHSPQPDVPEPTPTPTQEPEPTPEPTPQPQLFLPMVVR